MKNWDGISNSGDSEFQAWIEQLPKVELHLHLEGAIPHEALWTLIQKYGGDPEVPNLKALKDKFIYRDFKHFIETWTWKIQFLREYEDFTYIAEEVARDLASQNIRYAEAFYCPPDVSEHGLKTGKLTEAIRKGLMKVGETEVELIADSARDYGIETSERVLNELKEVKDFGVIGFGMGGTEHDYPPAPFQKVYELAREFGFRTSVHAGEAAGAGSIWDAVRLLKVDRIGHGTRAYEDEDLLEHLAESRIPIEMCPISNVCTGVVKSIAEHPIRRYFERGIVVTVNTDDPKMFGNSLADEFMLLHQHFGFSAEEICALLLNGIYASWLPEEEKEMLAGSFSREIVIPPCLR